MKYGDQYGLRSTAAALLCSYLGKYGQKKKKQKIQKNQNSFVLLQMAISFHKLKILKNDLLYSIVDFDTFPNGLSIIRIFQALRKMQWSLEFRSFKGHFKIASTKMTLTCCKLKVFQICECRIVLFKVFYLKWATNKFYENICRFQRN